MGTWAATYPMYYRGVGDTIPHGRRRVPIRSFVPSRGFFRAFTAEDLEFWIRRSPRSPVLYMVSDPSDVSVPRPQRSHVVLRGVLTGDLTSVERIRRPCELTLPTSAECTATTPAPVIVERLGCQESNLVQHRWNVQIVEPPEDELTQLGDVFRRLSVGRWQRWSTFLGISKTLLWRLAADVFPPEGESQTGLGTSDEGLLDFLTFLYRTGNAPPVPETQDFIGYARMLLVRRQNYAPPKLNWIESRRALFEEADSPAILVDGEFNAARGREFASHWPGPPHTRVTVDTVSTLRRPRPRGVVVSAAPGARVLQQLSSGSVRHTVLLLYPWEASVYNSARKRLQEAAQRFGITDWPRIPMAPTIRPLPTASSSTLVPRPRTIEWRSQEVEEPIETGELPAPLETENHGPRVSVETPAGGFSFPPERIVVVMRGRSFREIECSGIQVGDVLVAPRGGGDPSAHEVVARICRRNPLMERTRIVAGTWRQFLRQYVAKTFGDAPVVEIYRRLETGVTYSEFRLWLKEDDPVAPRREHLVLLLRSLGYSSNVVDLIYAAAVDHRHDRRIIYDFLFRLATGRLDEILGKAVADENEDRPEGISIEDLASVVRFDTVTKVTAEHGS